MVAEDLLEIAVQLAAAGQSQLAQYTKQLVSSDDSPIVELLDFSDDATFLEPSLFGYLGREHCPITLGQILYGYLPAGSAPPQFAAYADDEGIVYLPRFGHLAGDCRNTRLNVSRADLERRLTPLRHVRGTGVEFCSHTDPLLRSFFRDETGQAVQVELEATACHAGLLDGAFDRLRRATPILYDALLAVTRRVVVFQSRGINSFATIAAHGTAFLNVTEPKSLTEAFFIEDLSHQCGHILFNAMTVDRGEFFAADPAMPLQRLTKVEDERRDLYTACHGVFTETLMCMALFHCLETKALPDEWVHELLGRLSFIMKRFHLDLLHLQHDGLFTDQGVSLFQACGAVFDHVYRRTQDRITRFDLSNQSYTFSWDRFRLANRGA